MDTLDVPGYVLKEECVFVDYLPINLHEEVVTSVVQDEESFQIPLGVKTELVSGMWAPLFTENLLT